MRNEARGTAPKLNPPRSGFNYKVLLAGGKTAFVKQGVIPRLEATFPFEVVSHVDYDYPRQWQKPIPVGVEVVILLADMASTHMQAQLHEHCKTAGVLFVRGMRKWATMHECVLRAGFAERAKVVMTPPPPPPVVVEAEEEEEAAPPPPQKRGPKVTWADVYEELQKKQQLKNPPEVKPPPSPPQEEVVPAVPVPVVKKVEPLPKVVEVRPVAKDLEAISEQLVQVGLDRTTITIKMPDDVMVRIARRECLHGVPPDLVHYDGEIYMHDGVGADGVSFYRKTRVVSAFRLA